MFSLTCKRAATLLSVSMDGRLTLQQYLLLRLHLRFCTLCMRFKQQLLTIRQLARTRARRIEAVQTTDTPVLSDAARERIKLALRN
jgi:hypothetical protein